MVVITYYNARDDGNGEIRGIRGGQYMKDLRTEKGIIMSKNIKVTMTAIFSMCILLVAAAGVKADSNLQQKTVHILTKQEKEQKQELQQIKKELTNHSKSYQKNETEGETVEEQESALGKEQYDYSKAFRVQLIDDLMITAYKKKGKNIDKLFGDTYEWYVPYTTKSGRAGITMLQKVNGKYQWMSESDDGEIGQTVLDKDKVASVVAKVISAKNTIKDIRLLRNELYYLNMIYVKCAKESYMIPFADAPDVFNAKAGKKGLVNGKVYTTKEFMSLMNTMFDEQLLLNADPDTSGNALPYRQKSSKYMGFVILFLICGGAAIIGCRLFDRQYTR